MASDRGFGEAMSSRPTTSRETRRIAEILRPLGAGESKRAIATAVAYLKPELNRDGVSRFRVLGAELQVTRPRDKSARRPVRQVEVLVVDYLNARQVRVVVENGQVVEVRDLEGQPAFEQGEIEEATKLATEVPALRTIARRRNVFVSSFASGGSEPGSRRMGLYFVLSRGGAPAVPLATAVVDLVEERVLEHEIRPAGEVVGRRGGSAGRVR
jgi:hypothetical protein